MNEHGEENYGNVANIINEYIAFYIDKLKEIIVKREAALLTEAMNCLTTVTTIVPHDFFDSGKVEKCSDELFMKDFNNPTILFTDLKDSTRILEKCEYMNRTCLYTGYIYYSSCLLADILNLVNGKIVEITGDGTYSIIEENNDKMNNVLKQFYKNFDLYEIDICDLYNYIHIIGDLPYELIHLRRCSDSTNSDTRFRNFIFCIFTKFNIEINKFLEANKIDISFFSRVGCKKGPCKITRFKIDGHIHVDKLIGSTVNKAAHQAMGK